MIKAYGNYKDKYYILFLLFPSFWNIIERSVILLTIKIDFKKDNWMLKGKYFKNERLYNM